MISLALGKLEVDWGKNSFYSDHGALFQSNDFKPIPYYYAGDKWPEDDPIVEMEEGLAKPLCQVKDRLELLGYTLKSIEHSYEKLHQFHDMEEHPIPFSELKDALFKVDVSTVNGNYGDDFGPGEFVREEILERLALISEQHHYHNSDLKPDHWEIDLLLENFGANNGLRLLAENPLNLQLDVSWGFTPLIESGWATKENFTPGPSEMQRFLIVTEGSSDAKIIQKALELLRPHVSDFFKFVDMEEGYPFSGTGNLFRFTQGLVSIGIQNNVIILYDNDAEGVAKLAKTLELNLPINLRAIKLPQLADFEKFPTEGPTGESEANINRKAASIECYLDLAFGNLPSPIVRWSSYNSEANCYQGELLHKTQYMRTFLSFDEIPHNYDISKLNQVLESILNECIRIAETKQIESVVTR
tara:strand:+ start:158802 stop:160046 length:1245 start_codon:yes stop_codon:yes gene_type:complete